MLPITFYVLILILFSLLVLITQQRWNSYIISVWMLDIRPSWWICFRRIRSRHESGVRHEKVYPWPSHSNWRCSRTGQLDASTTRNRPMGAALRRKFGAPLPCHTGGASPENTGSIPAQKADQSRGSRSRNYGLTIRTVLLLRSWPFGWLLVDVFSWTMPKCAVLKLIRNSIPLLLLFELTDITNSISLNWNSSFDLCIPHTLPLSG